MNNESTKQRVLDSLPAFLAVVVSMLIGFYIRTIPKASVFVSDNFVRFSGNDPWYHFRNVQWILEHFPDMIWFDAYTNFPYGTHQVFAPLFDIILSAVIWLISFGNPSHDLISTVCAYYPVFLGVLVIIPAYFAGKWIYGRGTGILTAILLSIAPGQFLSRSMIGFNDHHIAETLFSVLVAMFIIIALVKSREHEFSFDCIRSRDWVRIKSVMPYFIFAGITLGLYTLIWKGALFFSFLVGVYITIQHIADHLQDKDTSYLAIGGLTIFTLALLFVLSSPYIGGTKYLQIKGLVSGIVAFPLLTLASRLLQTKGLKKYYYPLLTIGSFITAILIAKMAVPGAYELVTNVYSYFMRSGGGLTIAEASPLLMSGGEFSFAPLWYNFGSLGIISLFAICYLGYRAYKHKAYQEEMFLLVWTLVIIWAMLQQNRFTYYYIINASILSSFIGIKILESAGWDELVENFKSKVNTKDDFITKLKKIESAHLLAIFLVVFILILPSGMISSQYVHSTGGPSDEWVESLRWMNNNTPDPGLDFKGEYHRPSDEKYDYPKSAYGVMSWWDYGHWIEVIGQRIPNANPFQQGIGGRQDSKDEEAEPGASTFFTAPTEEKATEILDKIHPDENKMGARYIVTDLQMATNKFYAMASWTLDTDGYYKVTQTSSGSQKVPGERYFDSMEAKLHMFDGRHLEQYRMVHESNARNSQVEKSYKTVYNQLHGGSLPSENTGYVKTFEFVEGATIKGNAPEGTEVKINVPVKTNKGRVFEYSQTTTAKDGIYSFVVPYSTTEPIGGETQFDVKPIENYTIECGDKTADVSIDENDILNGGTLFAISENETMTIKHKNNTDSDVWDTYTEN